MSKQFETTEASKESDEIEIEEELNPTDPCYQVFKALYEQPLSQPQWNCDNLFEENEDDDPELPSRMAECTQYQLIKEIPSLLQEEESSEAAEEIKGGLFLFQMFDFAYAHLNPEGNKVFKEKMEWTQTLYKNLQECRRQHENVRWREGKPPVIKVKPKS